MKRTPRHVEPPSFQIAESLTAEEWREIKATAKGDPLGYVNLMIYGKRYILSFTEDEVGQEVALLWDYSKLRHDWYQFLEMPDLDSELSPYPLIPTVPS